MYGRTSGVHFEDFAEASNFFYLAGYDPSVIAFLLGNGKVNKTPKNAKELFLAAMDQSLLNMLKVVPNKLLRNGIKVTNKRKHE